MNKGAGLALLAVLLAAPVGALADSAPLCAADRVVIETAKGPRAFRVEVAATPAARSRGLMGRHDLDADQGMLFLYDAPQPALFWMKDTPLALDMIFADATGRVSHVHPDARPFDETPIPGGDDVLAVVEVRAGTAARLGIGPGARLAHPALPQRGAAWPCAQ